VKHLLAGVLVVALFAVAGSRAVAAQAPPDRAAIEKTLMNNEIRINEAFARRDVAFIKTLIDDDGMGVDMMGASSVAEFLMQLPTMDFKISDVKLADFKYLWLEANTVVMMYTWTGKGTVMGQPVPSPAYASTVWHRRPAGWRAVFHQETAAMTAKK
jgi:hypothetical protein